MSESSSHSSSSVFGLGISGLLTIIFVIAKIMGKIDWSWWVVFSPLIVSFSLFLVLLIVTLAIGFWVVFKKK